MFFRMSERVGGYLSECYHAAVELRELLPFADPDPTLFGELDGYAFASNLLPVPAALGIMPADPPNARARGLFIHAAVSDFRFIFS